uniref:non-specific serine/threonine protein kinase n=1 Tax=Panagrolaimus davidi TaxID=227884 RepID=A0A914Q1Q0_9BILA
MCDSEAAVVPEERDAAEKNASDKIKPSLIEASAAATADLDGSGANLSEVDVEENAQDVKENAPELSSKSPKDFFLLEEIGEGSYSTVHIGCERKTSRKFAIKICSKLQIIREKKTTQIFREKECLTLLSTNENFHPFIVRLYCTFQDKESLYFVMSLASRKDLLQVLKKKKKFSIEEARFAAAEIAVALDHIHKFYIVHRDVKPENILLSDTGHMVLSDFGCAKFLEQTEEEKKELETRVRKSSFVGTAHYVCPEVLLNKPIDETCDYWALGCTIFQLLTGERPFNDVSEYFIFKRITSLRYSFPDDFPPSADDAKDLIQQCLQIESADRLGSKEKGGAEALKAHPFFNGIEDWEKLPESTSPLLG